MKPFIFEKTSYTRIHGMERDQTALLRFASTQLLPMNVHWIPIELRGRALKVPYYCFYDDCSFCLNKKKYPDVLSSVTTLGLLSHCEAIQDVDEDNVPFKELTKAGPALISLSLSLLEALHKSVGKKLGHNSFCDSTDFVSDKNFLVVKKSRDLDFKFEALATKENRTLNIKDWRDSAIAYMIANYRTITDDESALAASLSMYRPSIVEQDYV